MKFYYEKDAGRANQFFIDKILGSQENRKEVGERVS
jgi:hypothetical protein